MMLPILVLVAVLVIWIVAMFNGLVALRTRSAEAWSDIDVQLKRRYDLIPNLVETVKAYASHEQGTLEKVIAARNAAMQVSAGDMQQKLAAENQLSSTLKSIFALSEAYPDLKANQNFMRLQDELTDTENKIQAARRFYNGNVRDLNAKIEMFPTNIIAGMFNFTKREFFEIGDAAQRENVQVKF
ncbi:MAG: LemA family protein [Candidatus Magasanikbacteria bacterium]|nr:LemA family protein [Candidatus Magasanikbacteria bacterium]